MLRLNSAVTPLAIVVGVVETLDVFDQVGAQKKEVVGGHVGGDFFEEGSRLRLGPQIAQGAAEEDHQARTTARGLTVGIGLQMLEEVGNNAVDLELGIFLHQLFGDPSKRFPSLTSIGT